MFINAVFAGSYENFVSRGNHTSNHTSFCFFQPHFLPHFQPRCLSIAWALLGHLLREIPKKKNITPKSGFSIRTIFNDIWEAGNAEGGRGRRGCRGRQKNFMSFMSLLNPSYSLLTLCLLLIRKCPFFFLISLLFLLSRYFRQI